MAGVPDVLEPEIAHEAVGPVSDEARVEGYADRARAVVVGADDAGDGGAVGVGRRAERVEIDLVESKSSVWS